MVSRALIVPSRGGRPAFEPTPAQRKLVQGMAALGMTHKDIASVIEDKNGNAISSKTLERHFPKELEQGAPKANATIGKRLFDKAMSGDAACLIFWAKTRMGWKETRVSEIGGIDGKPIETTQKPTDLSALTDEELEVFHKISAKLGGDKG